MQYVQEIYIDGWGVEYKTTLINRQCAIKGIKKKKQINIIDVNKYAEASSGFIFFTHLICIFHGRSFSALHSDRLSIKHCNQSRVMYFPFDPLSLFIYFYSVLPLNRPFAVGVHDLIDETQTELSWKRLQFIYMVVSLLMVTCYFTDYQTISELFFAQIGQRNW